MSKNLKLKKVNKSFVPEPISCFSGSYLFEHYECFMHVNILVEFLDVDMLQKVSIGPYFKIFQLS